LTIPCATNAQIHSSRTWNNLELAEQESQEYQEYLNILNNESEESSSVPALETELEQLLLEESQLQSQLEALKVEEDRVGVELKQQAVQREELEKEEERYWREYSRHKQRLLQAEDEYRSLDSQLRSTQTQLEKLKKTNVLTRPSTSGTPDTSAQSMGSGWGAFPPSLWTGPR